MSSMFLPLNIWNIFFMYLSSNSNICASPELVLMLDFSHYGLYFSASLRALQFYIKWQTL